MNRKIVTVSLAVATAATVAATLSLTAAAAPDHHFKTEHYDAKTVSIVKLDPVHRVATVDLSSRHIATAGRPSGAAVFTCHLEHKHPTYEPCKGAIALRGGVIFGTARITYSNFRLTGRVTGGSGAYRGAAGTFSAVVASGKHSILTLTYKT